jgi:hypothetical protein
MSNNAKLTRANFLKECYDILDYHEQLEFVRKIFLELDNKEQAKVIYECCSQQFKNLFTNESKLYDFYMNND